METDYFDIQKVRENEIILDLNEELPIMYEKKYDLVIDTGTHEHCFNVGTAFINMLKLFKNYGCIVTNMSPMNYPNHGFWNFFPPCIKTFLEKILGRCYFI